MHKTVTTALTGLIAACLVAAGWFACSLAIPVANAATTSDSVRTLQFAVQFSPFTVIDFGPTSVRTVTDLSQSDPSVGDVSVFRDRLLRAGKVVGSDSGTCTIVRVDLAADPPLDITCQVVFDLPGGSIATQGNATNDPVKHLVVTGGTGAYVDAAGAVTLTEFADNTGAVVIRLAG
jgi:Dirigent-like protein